MRKLIYAINLTLDGCFDHDKITPDDKLLDYWTATLLKADLLVYGRVTFQLMDPYWRDVAQDPSASGADLQFAKAYTSRDKIVFSRSLDRVADPRARIATRSLFDEISKLKQEPGKDMLVGGVSLPSQLIALGWVDEFLFLLHPVIAGDGKRLMEGIGLKEGVHLKLIESNHFESGTVALRYSFPGK